MPVRRVNRKTPTGVSVEWHAAFTEGGVRYRKQGFETKREAERWIKLRTDEVVDLAFTRKATPQQGKKLADFLQEWLLTVEHGHHGRPPVERTTLQSYRAIVNCHLTPIMGSMDLALMKPPHVVQARTELLKTRTRQIARRSLIYLRMALKYAVEMGYLDNNPAATVVVSNDTRKERSLKIPSRHEMGLLLAQFSKLADNSPSRWMRSACLVYVLQGTGLRISEARGLTWASIDFDNKVLTVNQRADVFNAMGRTKSQSARRRVHLDDVVIGWLERWRPLCPKGKLGLVFPNTQGGIASHFNLYHRDWVPACRKAGLMDEQDKPRFGFHCTRHYRVSTLIASGVSVRKIMDEIGHSSSAITLNVYSHVFDEDSELHRETINRIAARSPQTPP